MQLKIRRSQREGGVISKNVIFCLDARVDFSSEEAACIQRYKLGREALYNSEAQKQLLDRRDAAMASGSTSGSLKAIALTAFAATKLYVTVNSLQQGQHIECKSLGELLGAEDAIMTACESLRSYLDAASTFDGTEVVVDFNAKGPELVAMAKPQQQMVAAQPAPSAPVPQVVALAAAPAAADMPRFADIVIPDAQPASPSIADVPMSPEFSPDVGYDPTAYPPVDTPLESLVNWWNGLKSEHKLFIIAGGLVFLLIIVA